MACKKLRRTQLVHEDTRLNEFAYKLQNRIQAALCTNLGVNWSNFLFVDQDDPSTTPQRGSLTDKYGTIQAAVDAAHEGDVILINPGNYDEDLDLSNIVNGVTIQGAGVAETFITGVTAGDPAVLFAPPETNTPLITLAIKDLTIYGNPSEGQVPVAKPILINCDNLPESFALGKFMLQNVHLLSIDPDAGCTSLISCVNGAILDNVYTEEQYSVFVIRNSKSVAVSDSTFRNVAALYDYSETVPPGRRETYYFYQSSIGDTLTVSKQCLIHLDSECEVKDIVANFETSTGEIPIDGKITFEGYVTNDVYGTYTNTSEDFTTKIIADFDHAKINNLFHWTSTKGSNSAFDVVARNAVFSTQPEVSGDVISADGTNIGGLQLCRMDISNSTFKQSCLDITSGSLANATGIDRSVVFYPSNAIAQQPAVTSFAISPPFVSPVYNVHYEVTNSVGFPVIVTSSKAVDSFDASSELAGTNACVTLIQQK